MRYKVGFISSQLLEGRYLLHLQNCEDERSTFFRNVGKKLLNHSAQPKGHGFFKPQAVEISNRCFRTAKNIFISDCLPHLLCLVDA